MRATRLNGAEEDKLVENAKKDWPAWDRDIPVLLLRPHGLGRWRGVGIDPQGNPRLVTYDKASGLVFEV